MPFVRKGILLKQYINNYTNKTPNQCFKSAKWDLWFISLVMFLSLMSLQINVLQSIQCCIYNVVFDSEQELIMGLNDSEGFS